MCSSWLSLDRCLVYLDDVIVFSRSFDEHLVNLECVFERLAQAGLTLKLSKCTFCRKEVRYLGHIVGSGGIRPDSCVLSYPAPKNLKELQAFLGLANYYRRFICSLFLHCCTPLPTYKENGQGVCVDACL